MADSDRRAFHKFPSIFLDLMATGDVFFSDDCEFFGMRAVPNLCVLEIEVAVDRTFGIYTDVMSVPFNFCMPICDFWRKIAFGWVQICYIFKWNQCKCVTNYCQRS